MKLLFYIPTMAIPVVWAQDSLSIFPPNQPAHKGRPGEFEIIGNTLVSAQQIFLGRPDKIYILDKVENNAAQINGHPAWAAEYRLSDNSQRLMNIVTNTFCAGGASLGNGTWVNIGGNQAVSRGGLAADKQDGSSDPYHDADGRRSVRLLDPCDGNDCEWRISSYQIKERWYPTVETLEDGSVIIIGGSTDGSYVNDASKTEPTYEFFPLSGPATQSPILQNTLPANLYPLTWLLPSGKLLLQSNWKTSLLDYKAKVEVPLDDMPEAVRTYPASAASVMLSLTPANNWTATIMFCGGSNVAAEEWISAEFVAINRPAATSCVKITPDISKSYERDDPLPEGRTMASLVLLPDGKILCLNGAKMGTAGYGSKSWAIGQSYADSPILTPVIYDPTALAGQRWSNSGFAASTVPRMYHSTALLLADGSIFVSGSNPNTDFSAPDFFKYFTEYRTERFYPPYYNERRPQPKRLPTQLSYGGPIFEVLLDSDDLFGDAQNTVTASVVIIRQGFSTHALAMGQRRVVLESTYTSYANHTAVLHVSQVPPNPAILAPGPAMLFVVVRGVPSVGVQVMIGSGQIGPQPILPRGPLPPSSTIQNLTAATTPNTQLTSNATLGSSNSTYGWLILWVVLVIFWK